MSVPLRAARVAAVAAVVAAAALAGCRAGGDDSAETVLRTLRLAGYEIVAAGKDGGTAVTRLEMPSVTSPADVELGWQSAFAAMTAAYPRARAYRVVLAGPPGPLGGASLLAARAPGSAVREAVAADDAAGLRRVARFEYVPDPDERLPRGTLAVTGTPAADPLGPRLDVENRAAGLLGESGPTGEGGRIAESWKAAYAAVPGRAAPADVAADAVSRINAALASSDADREEPMLRTARSFSEAVFSMEAPAALRVCAAVAEAVASPAPYGSVLAGTAAVAREVARTPAGAARPAAGPVAGMDRAPVLDAASDSTATALPSEVMARYAPAGDAGAPALPLPDGTALAARSWLAYRSQDGVVFWLPEPGSPYALTDGSLLGWGYRARRAFLVDSANVDRVIAVYPVN